MLPPQNSSEPKGTGRTPALWYCCRPPDAGDAELAPTKGAEYEFNAAATVDVVLDGAALVVDEPEDVDMVCGQGAA